MKKTLMNIHCKWFFSLLMVVLLGHVGGAQERVFKKLEKSFTLDNSGEIILENKYGDIEISGWSKNSASIVVNIEVTHRKEEDAKSLLDRIQSEIIKTGDYIEIKTTIEEKSTGLLGQYFEKVNPFDYNESNLKINYTIYVPEKADLTVVNSFGDVVLADWGGNLRTTVEHGDIWINGDINMADIELQYGKLKANSITNGDIRLKNGELDLGTCDRLRLNSSGSGIKMDKIHSMDVYSNKDQLSVEEVGSIKGAFKFANLQIDKLYEDVDLALKISELTVNHILKSDVQINLNQESSEVTINIKNTGVVFSARLEEGLLRLPKSFDKVESNLLDKSNRIREISAIYGKPTTGKITIHGKKGVVVLKES